MEVHLSPEVEAQLTKAVKETGRAADELVQDAMIGYLEELARVRNTLDRRYDEIKGGQTKPLDGEEVLARFRRRSEERSTRS